MPDFLNRFKLMLNKQQLKNLANAKVIVFGVGGVGSAVCHFLVRSGVGQLDIVDFDCIDITNINRQLVAYQDNVGKLKVDELKKQLLNINTKLKINAFPIKLSELTIKDFDITKYSYICDCIDDISAKKLLIKQAKAQNVHILSAMGAGNRFQGIPHFEIADIYKTSYDPIAKILRKYCAEEGIKKLNVCYTKQKAHKFDCKIIGSVVYYPVEMACVMSAKIINDIVGEL